MEILGTRININFGNQKLGLEIKRTMDRKCKTYMCHTDTI